MTTVAVVAHRRKTVGGGLPELRRRLADAGIDAPVWYEIAHSRSAPQCVEAAMEAGADVVFAWGGDGTVQRCVDVLAGSGVDLAIVPAGTANLLATNLGIPRDIGGAVDAGLYGERRAIDVGSVNGERFAVMAGAGFDGRMLSMAGGRAKRWFGRLAYVVSAARAARRPALGMEVEVDGHRWFKGQASCVLLGNVGTVTGGLRAFPSADPADGRLEVGVVTADGMLAWLRVFVRMATGRSDRSPLVTTTSGQRIDVRFERKVRYELDGGPRTKTRHLKVRLEPSAISVRVPAESSR